MRLFVKICLKGEKHYRHRNEMTHHVDTGYMKHECIVAGKPTLNPATLSAVPLFIFNIPRFQPNKDPTHIFSHHTYTSRILDVPAYATGNEIYLNTKYIASYTGDVKREITGVLYHEATHIWQWNGNGNGQPNIGNLTEGIADYVRLKGDLAPSHWQQPGEGYKWDQGYDVTARFLDYCNSLREGFVAELNGKMRNDYNDNFFVELLGKSVDQLWTDYKTMYGK
ncbi:hypothetical protein IFM89_001750 [Coptis chinensis]|uniref:Plant basic secretory protein (BSP) family protein n=1 Tax=Coptis chinensis TaxID=261450 RepID=A0A835HI02_9MAGN|nr:hypothetical protein IFM89_001750 [Coptis chinensis]